MARKKPRRCAGTREDRVRGRARTNGEALYRKLLREQNRHRFLVRRGDVLLVMDVTCDDPLCAGRCIDWCTG